MSKIAAEGEISKGLLFHYFLNKKELYMYLWNNAMEQTRKATSEYRVTETTDFFEMIHRALQAKCSLMGTSPYLYQFSVKAYYEQEPEIRAVIQESFQQVSENSENVIWQLVGTSKLRNDIDMKLMYQEILWVSDGYLRQMMQDNVLEPAQMERDFSRMIEQWKKVYLK